MEELNRTVKETDICKLTLHNYSPNIVAETLHDINSKSAVTGRTQIRPESSTLLEEHTEVIKVYLEQGRQQDKEKQSVTMLTDEVSQIQEVRYCLKTLREKMAARHNNKNTSPTNGIRVHLLSTTSPVSNTNMDVSVPESQEQECVRLREMNKRLYAQLQEAEMRHQEGREALQAENRELLQRLEEQDEHLQLAQTQAESHSQRTEELQKLLDDLQLRNASLHDQMSAGEAELQELRALKDGEDVKRCKQLEKEQAVLKEKIHHLDDMLKCQQRKVRNMIEQLQNSRVMMEERNRMIEDLEEKVGFLEAENREMRDQIEFGLGDQSHRSGHSEAQIVYSKPLTPTSQGQKSLPFIKVIEIKS